MGATTMMGMNTMQTSQYGKSAFIKVFVPEQLQLRVPQHYWVVSNSSAQNLGAKPHFYMGFKELGLIVWSVDRFGLSLESHQCFKFL